MFKFTLASALLMIVTSMSAQTGSTDAGSAELAHIQSGSGRCSRPSGNRQGRGVRNRSRIRAKPEMAIDKTKAAGGSCFKSSEGTMVHYASQPEATAEDVVYKNSTPPSFSQPGLTRSGVQSFQLWATWNPVNGISSRMGS